jgi:endogenous inhibitor of DNA gyrase (YacG/DUF329 family)
MISVRCPICNQVMDGASVADWPQFPFCSARCQTIDLGRWLGERYRVGLEGEGGEPQENAEEIDIP